MIIHVVQSIQQLQSTQHLQQLRAQLPTATTSVYIWSLVHSLSDAQRLQKEQQLEQAIQKVWHVHVECLLIPEQRDFQQLLSIVDAYMHRLAMHEPFEQMGYMSTTITLLDQAVLLEGAKTFEERFCTLHPNMRQHYDEVPNEPSWLQLFQSFLHEYDYASALEMVEQLDEHVAAPIRNLLYVQLHRLNFNFKEALTYLQLLSYQHDVLTETHALLQQLATRPSQQQALAEIAELYRHIYVTLQKEDWSSFLIRFYRAREAVIHYLLIYVAQEQKPRRNEPLFKQIETLEEAYESGRVQAHYGTYFYIKSANVINALQVRNESIIGHSRAAIEPKQLFFHYFGTSAKSSQMPHRFLADTRIMLRDLGTALDDNMTQVNHLLFEWMTAALKEEL